jgi:hypothetical protein
MFGKGNFGTVYLVQHKAGHCYALKSLSRREAEEKKILRNYFLTERKVMLGLDHPFIIKMIKSLKNESQKIPIQETKNTPNVMTPIPQEVKVNKVETYRNMSLTDLESEIFGICDNPSSLFKDTSPTLENELDNFIDNIFAKNNIIPTDQTVNPCSMCHDPYDLNKQEMNHFNDVILNNFFSNSKPKEENETLGALMNQLNDLENLVKTTKKELLKYENRDHTMENLFY